MRDDLTVIVTTFKGREAFARRAIASAEGQARVIVMDDGERPADHAYACWWEGVYRAQTPYVTILHDDDWYEPTFVERCRALIEQSAFVATEARIHTPDGERNNLGWSDGYKTLPDLMSLAMALSPSCCMYRREDVLRYLLVGGIPFAPRRAVICGPDALLSLLTAKGRGAFQFIAAPLVNFDGGEQSSTINALASGERKAALLQGYADARAFCQMVHACS